MQVLELALKVRELLASGHAGVDAVDAVTGRFDGARGGCCNWSGADGGNVVETMSRCTTGSHALDVSGVCPDNQSPCVDAQVFGSGSGSDVMV